MSKFLIVNNSESSRRTFKSELRKIGHDASVTSTAEGAIGWLDINGFGCMVIDYNIGMDGVNKVLDYMRTHGRYTPIVLVRNPDERPAPSDAASIGVVAEIVKPDSACGVCQDLIDDVVNAAGEASDVYGDIEEIGALSLKLREKCLGFNKNLQEGA
jgi:DNA-binding NtrC family response regulator